MQNGSLSTTVGVFDGDVPFVQRGLGSKRLLSMGMHINISDGASVLLVDEIETGGDLIDGLTGGLVTAFANMEDALSAWEE